MRLPDKEDSPMRKAWLLGIILLVCITDAAGQWQSQLGRFSGMDSAMIRRLFKDGPFTVMRQRTKTEFAMVTTGVIIEAQPHAVWLVLTDYSLRPKIITGVSKIEDLKVEGNKATFTQRNSIKFSFIKFTWEEYRVHVHYPEKSILFYDPKKPDFALGGYELIPLDDGKATLLLYSYTADLRSMGFPVGTMAREIPFVEELLMTSAGVMVVTGAKNYLEKK
jgi:hypothetical protein